MNRILLNVHNAEDVFPTASESYAIAKKADEQKIHPKCLEELEHVINIIQEKREDAEFEADILMNLRQDTLAFMVSKGYIVSKIVKDSITSGSMVLGYNISWKING